MRWEKYNFTDDFQDAILACLIKHPEEFYSFGEIIKPEYFNGPSAATLIFRLNDYRREYGSYPNFSTLGNYAYHRMAELNVDQANEMLDYVEKLAQMDTKDWPAIRDLAIRFAKERALYDAIRKIHSAQVEGKGATVNAVKLVEDAMAVGTNFDDLGICLHDPEKIIAKVNSRDYGVHTAYPEFDRLWKYGWGPGWLIVLLAPPKRFKTAFSINLALNIVRTQDVDVLYYACEISQELAAYRALTNVTGWTQDEFFNNPGKGTTEARKHLTPYQGTVWFKGFPSKGVSISEIKTHAKQVVRVHGLKPRAIVIDYAETVRPDSTDKKAPDWRQQAEIYTQARALGHELGCCVIMPDRCNRETVGHAVPSMKSFQGSFEKAGIVDVAIGICATEQEYLCNRTRYFVFLNRHGDAFKHYEGKVDPERMQMTVDREIAYEPEDEQESKPPSGSKRKQKYTPGRRARTELAKDLQED